MMSLASPRKVRRGGLVVGEKLRNTEGGTRTPSLLKFISGNGGQMRPADNCTRWLRVNARQVSDENGECSQLLEPKTSWHAVFAHFREFPVTIVITAIKGNITAFNVNCCRVFVDHCCASVAWDGSDLATISWVLMHLNVMHGTMGTLSGR